MRVVTVLVLASCFGCSNGARRDDAPDMPTPPPTTTQPTPAASRAKVVLTTPSGDASVDVEVVATPQKIMQGLMYREHLPPEAGMLFIMGRDEDHEFWMKNTLIPLDMIFITKDMTVAGFVQNAEPRSLKHVSCGAISSYVLEVNGGWVAAHKLEKGAKVVFDGVQ
ncbi:MAG: DUF192 domain-containing protein [Kofleriaceae bacterium]